jgi:hypothetical protein
MFSESDYYFERNSYNISQTTINIIIVIILITIFFFLFNFCSKNYFTNLNSNSQTDLNQKESTKVFNTDFLLNSNFNINNSDPNIINQNRLILFKEDFLNKKFNIETEEKQNESQKVINTDFLLNSNGNINNSDPNINYQNNFANYNNIPNNDIVLEPVVPPIIYDPIENYDRLKLLDPLVDPRGRSSADQIPTPQVAAQLNFPTQGIIDRYHRVGLLKAIDNHDNNNNRRRNSYEDFGNIEKVVNGKKVNIDSDSSSDNKSNYDNSSRLSRYSDNSSDLQTISSSYNSKFKEKIIPNNVILEVEDKDNDILELIGKKIAHDWYRYFTSISKGNKIIKINVHNKNRKELYDGDVVYIPILKRHYKVKLDKLDMIDYNPYFF